MRLTLLAASILLATGLAQADQLYRWVDADGRVHYTDQLPPAEARQAERKKLGDKPGTQPLPYAVQEAARNFPVTLYTAKECGDACNKASAYLSKRGVPHQAKDAQDPEVAKVLASLSGGKMEVPLLTVGSNVVRGYEEGAWGRALDAAGYPSSTALPVGVNPVQPAPKPQPQRSAAPGADKTPAEPRSNN